MDPSNHRQAHQAQNPRFSWQMQPTMSPEEEIAARTSQPQSRQRPAGPQQNSRAFSYIQTPIEHRAPQYESNEMPPLPQNYQSPPTPIDPRPQSIYDPRDPTTLAQPQIQPQYASATAYDQRAATAGVASHPHYIASSAPTVPQSTTHPALRSPSSPVHGGVVASQQQQSYQQEAQPQQPQQPQHPQGAHHTRQRSSLARINTNITKPYAMPPLPQTPHSAHRGQASPLPAKTPLTPASPGPLPQKRDIPMSPHTPKSIAKEPYSPHGFGPHTPSQAGTVFSPDAATGPNGLDFALHQPGQIAHPNMDLDASNHEWKHGLCDCGSDVGLCVTGLFCPCVVYGKTSYRLGRKSERKDATDILGWRKANGACGLMSLACGVWCLFPLIQRTRIRHMYKLTGSLAGDISRACCCCCCVAIQNEREVRDREESARRWAGPASTEVYRSPMQMRYEPQN